MKTKYSTKIFGIAIRTKGIEKIIFRSSTNVLFILHIEGRNMLKLIS